jgi:flagellar motor protein MotB
MATKGCKCDPHDICEECPEWIFTLADLIMCMMGLFVILWVLKQEGTPGAAAAANTGGQTTQTQAGTPPSPELIEVIAAIRGAFGHEPDPKSSDPIDQALIMQRLRAHRPGDGEKGTSVRPADGAEGTDPDVTSIRLGAQTAIGGPVLFASGSAELTPDARRQLDQIARIIRGHRNIVMVKGHTALDDHEPATSAQTRLDLSLRRAQVVADHLTGAGVSPDILRVLGCSTFEPVKARAYTTDVRAANRRVEVEVTASLAEQFQDRPRAEPIEVPAARGN